MGFELVPESPVEPKVWMVNHGGWYKILDLAQHHGWSPAGTLPPPTWIRMDGTPAQEADGQESWRGGYISNEGQLVTAADAANMATALEAAAQGMSDEPMGVPGEVAQAYLMGLTHVMERLAPAGVANLAAALATATQRMPDPPAGVPWESAKSYLLRLAHFMRESNGFYVT